jgi:hypothetical protein
MVHAQGSTFLVFLEMLPGEEALTKLLRQEFLKASACP